MNFERADFANMIFTQAEQTDPVEEDEPAEEVEDAEQTKPVDQAAEAQ